MVSLSFLFLYFLVGPAVANQLGTAHDFHSTESSFDFHSTFSPSTVVLSEIYFDARMVLKLPNRILELPFLYIHLGFSNPFKSRSSRVNPLPLMDPSVDPDLSPMPSSFATPSRGYGSGVPSTFLPLAKGGRPFPIIV